MAMFNISSDRQNGVEKTLTDSYQDDIFCSYSDTLFLCPVQMHLC